MNYRLCLEMADRRLNDDEYVLLPVGCSAQIDQEYDSLFSLSAVGFAVYRAIKDAGSDGVSVSACVERVKNEFDTSGLTEAEVERDVRSFIDDLVQARFVQPNI